VTAFARVPLAPCLIAGALALLPVAAEGGAGARPAVTLVSPMRVEPGAALTIRGRHFRPARLGNTVIFRAPNGRFALARARRATRSRIVVTVPPALERAGRAPGGGPVRFRMRVLAGRSLGHYTPRRLSPVVVLP
jgi:hypothetical protein